MITKEKYIEFAFAYKQRAWQYWVLNKPQYAFINVKMEIISLMKAEILTTGHSSEVETTLGFEDIPQLVKLFKASCALSGRKVDTILLQRFLDIGNKWGYEPEQYKSLCQLACQLLRTSCITEEVHVKATKYVQNTEDCILQYIGAQTSKYVEQAMRNNEYGDILGVLEQIAIDNSENCSNRLNMLLGVH